MKKIIIAIGLISLVACKKKEPVTPVTPSGGSNTDSLEKAYAELGNNFKKKLQRGVLYKHPKYPDSIYLLINKDTVVYRGLQKAYFQKYLDWGYYDASQNKYFYEIKQMDKHLVINPNPNVSIPNTYTTLMKIEFVVDSQDYVICKEPALSAFKMYR